MKKLIERRAVLKALLDKMLDTAKMEERAFTAEEDAEFAKTEAEITAINNTIAAEERAMAIDMHDVNLDKVAGKVDVEEMEERAFTAYICNKQLEERGTDVNLTYTDNGAIIPKSIANKIIKRVKEISPIYAMADRYNVNGTLAIPYYDESQNAITVAYADEFVELESNVGKFKSVELGGFLAGALSKISKRLINNATFDVVGFIVEDMAQAFAAWIEKESIKGTASKIDGLKGVTQVVTAASATAITADELMDVQEEVPDAYQNNAIWIMSKATRKKIRKLKDGEGNYLLNKDFTAKWGYSLLGKDVYVSDSMDEAAAGKTAIYYGDFSGLAIKVSEDINVEVLREKYATQHAVGVVGWAEIDAKVENAQKIAKLVMKAS